MDITLELVKTLGLPTALVVFFLWRDARREERRDEVERGLREFSQQTMLTTITQSREAVIEAHAAAAASKESLDELKIVVVKLTEVINQLSARSAT